MSIDVINSLKNPKKKLKDTFNLNSHLNKCLVDKWAKKIKITSLNDYITPITKKFDEINVKSILNKHKKHDSWFLVDYTLNPFLVCSFNCLYCYIR